MGFEPTISAGERPQIYALDRAATGTGCFRTYWYIIRELIDLCCIKHPVQVAMWSKVCGRSPAEIVGSKPTGGMDVCLL